MIAVAALERPAPSLPAAAPDDAPGVEPTASLAVARAVATHALAWLVTGSAAGCLLALLLVAPRLGEALAPIGYGRVAALHLDLTLYGWLALPWIGALLHAFAADRRTASARFALALWSGALAAGAMSWLGGRTSGKLFLDWRGPAAWFLLAAEVALAATLALGALAAAHEAREAPGRRARRGPTARGIGLGALWIALASLPAMLAGAASRAVYPAVDPTSGGPTGASLLGSSLGLVAMLLLAPRLLGLASKCGGGALAPAAWGAHFAAFLALGGGDHGNREPLQVVALASLAIWAWLVPHELARFRWPPGSRLWLRAMAGWGSALLLTGVVQFLPLALDRLKFTHALVAHAHLAMAGFASALGALLLHAQLAGGAHARLFARPLPFRLWNGALVVHVAALALLGALEATDAAAILRGGIAVDALLALRALAGFGMLGAGIAWLAEAAR